MKKIIKSILIVTSLGLSSIAAAGPTCTDGENENWVSETEMQKILKNRGYTWDKFKVSRGKCYEIYGYDATGKKVEVYFHPETAEIIKEKS